jgi:hypothetical protein
MTSKDRRRRLRETENLMRQTRYGTLNRDHSIFPLFLLITTALNERLFTEDDVTSLFSVKAYSYHGR